MKKTITIFKSIIIGFLLLTSCNDEETIVKNIKLSTNNVILKVGTKQEVKIIDGNGSYKIVSSNKNIKIENTKNTITITGKNAGEATIDITDSQNKSETISVKIYDILNVSEKNVELEINKKDTKPITNLVTVNGDIDNINISSSNPKVAVAKKVKTSEGTWNIEITAQGAGNCEIKVTDGEATEIIKVNVKLKSILNIKTHDNEGEYTINVGKEFTIYDTKSIPFFEIGGVDGPFAITLDKKGEYAGYLEKDSSNGKYYLNLETQEEHTGQDVILTISEKNNMDNSVKITLKTKPLVVKFSKDGATINLEEGDEFSYGKFSIKKGEKITVNVSGMKEKYHVESDDVEDFEYEGTEMVFNEDFGTDIRVIKEKGTFSLITKDAGEYSLCIWDTETQLFKCIIITVEE